MGKTIRIAALIAALVMAFSVVAQAGETSRQLAEESALTTILKRGSLRVGMDTFVPWAMKDKTGKFIGFEVDVARRFAADTGVDIEFVPTAWKGIIPALLAGKFDVLIGGMSIRADRARKVNFSIPYYYSGMSLVASKKKAAGFDSLEDFNKSGVTIAVRTGTTAHKAAQRYLPNAKIKPFEKEPQALQELLMNRAHAFVSMAPLPAQESAKHPTKLFVPFSGTFTKEPNGFALRKGDPDFLNYVNSWIEVVKAERWIEDRYHYWFETTQWMDQIQ